MKRRVIKGYINLGQTNEHQLALTNTTFCNYI